MKKLLFVIAIVVAAVPLLVRGQDSDQGVGALGQSVKRAAAPTGPAPHLPDGTIDLNGVWVGGGPVNDLETQGGLKKGELEALMLPWAKEQFAYRAKHEEEDPHYFCMPMGVPRSTPYPFRFVQNYTDRKPTHIFQLHEGNIHTFRQIFMDGRKHPAEIDASWFGHSIGWYEGDTLVIDTVGYNDRFWMDHRGHPHSEKMHTIERWTRKDMGHLENKVTIDDPGTYTKPFTVTFNARLSNPGDEMMEYICQENNQYGIAGGNANPYAGK